MKVEKIRELKNEELEQRQKVGELPIAADKGSKRLGNSTRETRYSSCRGIANLAG